MRIERSALHLVQPEIRRWSLRRKLRNPFAGLRFVRRSNNGDLILISRHWPHLLCWSWSLSWREYGKRRIGAYRRHNSGGSAWLGWLRLDWQDYGWMVSGRPDVTADAIAYVQAALRVQ